MKKKVTTDILPRKTPAHGVRTIANIEGTTHVPPVTFPEKTQDGEAPTFDTTLPRFQSNTEPSSSSAIATEMVADLDAQSLVGQTLDNKYLLQELIGAGGMGYVYKAQYYGVLSSNEDHASPKEKGLQFYRAIKIIKPTFLAKPGTQERFCREIKNTLKVSNKCEFIVRVDNCGFDQTLNLSYYVMDLLEGKTLTQRIQQSQQPLDILWCLDISLQLCNAIGAVHAEHIVHCDLNPNNIFLRTSPPFGTESVKLLDFGIARSLMGEDKDTYFQEYIAGSPCYISPEQIADPACSPKPHHINERSDIYALGCILFDMLTGHPPFPKENHDNSSAKVFEAHLRQSPPSPRDFRSEIPEALSDLVVRMLAKSPEDRPASASALASELLQLRHTYAPSITRYPSSDAIQTIQPNLAIPLAEPNILPQTTANLASLQAPPAIPFYKKEEFRLWFLSSVLVAQILLITLLLFKPTAFSRASQTVSSQVSQQKTSAHPTPTRITSGKQDSKMAKHLPAGSPEPMPRATPDRPQIAEIPNFTGSTQTPSSLTPVGQKSDISHTTRGKRKMTRPYKVINKQRAKTRPRCTVRIASWDGTKLRKKPNLSIYFKKYQVQYRVQGENRLQRANTSNLRVFCDQSIQFTISPRDGSLDDSICKFLWIPSPKPTSRRSILLTSLRPFDFGLAPDYCFKRL